MSIQLHSSVRCFNGYQKVYKHKSSVLDCEMMFGVYIPDGAKGHEFPGLFYLSGLTCTHANFMEKSGFQQFASKYGFVVVHPDTSPRGVDLPGDSDSWDFGKGAGFYLDATVEPWSKHYKMYSYVSQELPELVRQNLPVNMDKLGIFGHSMGGHGAITIALKNPALFKSVSAFAPICNPTECPWGRKVDLEGIDSVRCVRTDLQAFDAFSGYLGDDTEHWKQYDSALLSKCYSGPARVVLIDQGEEDTFYTAGQLLPESLQENDNIRVSLHMRPHFDHSYYFIATYIESHFEHHKMQLEL